MTTKLRSACDNCHQRKMRCSGHLPCQGCLNSRDLCFYSVSNQLGRPRGTKNRRYSAYSKTNTSNNTSASSVGDRTSTTTTDRVVVKESAPQRARRDLGNNNNGDDNCNSSGIWSTVALVSYGDNSFNRIDSGNHVPRHNSTYKPNDHHRSSSGLSDAVMVENCSDGSFNPTGSVNSVTSSNVPGNLNSNELISFESYDVAISEYRDNSLITPDSQSRITSDNLQYNMYNKDSSNLLQTDQENLEFQRFASNDYTKTQDFNFEDILPDVDSQIIPTDSISKTPKDTIDKPASTFFLQDASAKSASNICTCMQQHAELLSNPKLSEVLASSSYDDENLSMEKVLSLTEQAMKAWRNLIACTQCPYNDDQEVMLLTFMSIRSIVRYLQRLLPRYATTHSSFSKDPDTPYSSRDSALVIGGFEVTGNDRTLVFRFLFQNTLQKVKSILSSLQEIQDKKKKRLLDQTTKRTATIDDYEASSNLSHIQQISHRLATSIGRLELSLQSGVQADRSNNELE